MDKTSTRENSNIGRRSSGASGYPFAELSHLAEIKEFAQEVVMSIAAVTHVDVTIVDSNLVRIAGSGIYVEELDSVLTEGTISDQVLKQGKMFILEHPREDEHCAACQLKDRCHELAEYSVPINFENKTIGNLALIAFTEEQRRVMMESREDYIEYLIKMSRLLASTIEAVQKTRQVELLNKQLAMLMNRMDLGILYLDEKKRIQLFNDTAADILNVSPRNGEPISTIIPEVNWKAEKIQNQIFTRNNDTLSATAKPLGEAGEIIELHKISFLQEREQEIRRKMSHKTPFAVATFDDLIGNDDEFVNAVNMARKFAKVEATVLISAETGTGKELFAQSIHNHSPRSRAPFVAINCGALQENLLESELFGYAGGAFTGAKRSGKMGLFEQAHMGTIFLDEIAEMPIQLQSSLLRILQDKEVRRVGDEKVIPVDVRVIAATNKRLYAMVQRGEFREDLFYRLNMLRLRLPALRERKGDLPLLVQHFAIQNCRSFGREPVAFTREAMEVITSHRWPGNIRELFNVVQRAVLLTDSNMVERKLVRSILNDYKPGENDNTHQFELKLNGDFKFLTRQILQKLLDYYGDEDKVCELTGLSRTTLWRRLNSK